MIMLFFMNMARLRDENGSIITHTEVKKHFTPVLGQ
jgi:hypothetical protein